MGEGRCQATLGKITSIDAANKTVTVGGVLPGDLQTGDSVMVKPASGDLTGEALTVVGNQATISLQVRSGDAEGGRSGDGQARARFDAA